MSDSFCLPGMWTQSVSSNTAGFSRTELIRRLQSALSTTLSPFVSEKGFALVDFPDHPNVGDSAIWLGELEYFRSSHARAPSYVSSIRSHDDAALRKAVPEGTVFLHGGGNFGDIWQHHQKFREAVIEKWTDRPIVQLPQSIHYRTEVGIERTRRLIGKHGNFVLLVRDEESFQFACRNFDCETLLCPDSAFALGAIAAPAAEIDVLALLRTDDERAGASDAGRSSVIVEDWLFENRSLARMAKVTAAVGSVLQTGGGNVHGPMFEAVARRRVKRGVTQLSRARAIVTDRLHGHILSLLIGRPHAVLDNSYGKMGRFMDAFGSDRAITYRATDMADAVAWARQASALAA